MTLIRVCATATAAFLPAVLFALPPNRRCSRWNRAPSRVLVREAARAASMRIDWTWVLPLRCRARRRRPADSLLPGASPAHAARCFADGNRLMSTPISLMITVAARSPIPGMLVNNRICSVNGDQPGGSGRGPPAGARAAGVTDLLLDLGDHLVEVLEPGQVEPDHLPVMGGEPAGQCQPQIVALVTQAPHGPARREPAGR